MAGPPDIGTTALAAGRWAEARAAFSRSLDEAETAEALSGMAQALWWLGDMAGSVGFHERAYAASRRAGDSVSAAMTAIALSITYASNFADHAAASGWAGRAQTLLGPDPGPELECWLRLAQGYATADPRRALQQREAALALARLTGDPDLELCSLTAVGEALVLTGQVREGLSLVDEAMAATLAGEPRRLDTVAYTCCDMVVSCLVAGDVTRAVQWCRHADEFIGRYGCPFLYARCRISYGSLLMLSGDWVEADAQLSAAAGMAAQGGAAVHVQALAALALLRTRQGRLDEARGLLDGTGEAPGAAAPAAALLLAEGRPALAVAVLERRARDDALPWQERAALVALLVEAHLAVQDHGAARAAASRLRALAGRGDHDLPRGLAALVDGQVLAAAGDPEHAAGRLADAVEIFGRLDLPFERARGRRLLAAALADRSAEVAVAEARAALDTFEGLGAAPEADATASLLRALGSPGRRQPRSGAPLTRREEEVLALLAKGMSNPEIAARLYISRKTAAHHVSAVLAKLGVRRRAEAVALAARRETGLGGAGPGIDSASVAAPPTV